MERQQKFSELTPTTTTTWQDQVHLLKIESEVERERKKLAELRRRHYHGEAAEQ